MTKFCDQAGLGASVPLNWRPQTTPICARTLEVEDCGLMGESLLLVHAARNRELWDQFAADYQMKHGGQLAASGGTAWGVWQLPESQLRVLGDVSGRDVLELGCGAAQWSIALYGLGARVTALDNSARQLAHARVLMAAAAMDFPLVHARRSLRDWPTRHSTSCSVITEG